MSISQSLLPEFDQEMANTRRVLERVPDDQPSWAPHEKSMPLGKLSIHLAEIPTWTTEAVRKDKLDIAPPGGPGYTPPELKTREEILNFFDRSVAQAREALAGASDENLQGNWSLLAGGQTLFSMPRIAVIRTWVLNHMIHHRAQLGVYLRLNNIPVPGIYGPSADEQM
jgi:uncharacterized damage-inducible protein DinB